MKLFKTTTFVLSMVLTLTTFLSANAAPISEPLPDFETVYGGIAGFPNPRSTTFDFGTTFSAVNSVSLHLEGSSGGSPGSTLHFAVEVEGVVTPLTAGITDNPFEVDIPLLFDANILDGVGSIQLGLELMNNIHADVVFSISNAVLTFDTVPEPSTFAFSLIGLLGVSFRRRTRG